MSSAVNDPYEIVREVAAYGVAEGHYRPQLARVHRLGTYPTRREARNALYEVATAEAEAHGLVVDPWESPELVRLIPPDQESAPSGERSVAARLAVRKIEAPR